VLQIAYGDGEPLAERVARVADLVAAQVGADLVMLPELWPHGGFTYGAWAPQAELLDGSIVEAIARAAVTAGAVVHAGSLAEKVADGASLHARGPQGRGLWNTSVVLGRDGATLASYRKIHRFGFGEGEPALLEAGADVVTVPVPLAGSDAPVTTGLSTCYDLRFPELYRLLLDAGSEVFLIPAAWPLARVEHWRLLGRARAVENQCAVIQCNTAGTHSGVAMGGHSQIVAPTGEVLAEAGEGEEVLVAEVDVDEVTAWRRDFPVLADRRL
jgi:predicted amidohydrolase